MARLPNQTLLDFKRRLRRFKNIGEGDNSRVLLQVLGVYRQLIDSTFKSITGLDPGDHSECYDILVSDGNHKLKCVLHPECNSLIQKGQVTIGSIVGVKLSDADLHYNETDLSASSLVILNHLHVDPEPPLNLDLDMLAYTPEASEKEKGHVPLATRRGCYLSLWCAEDPFGQIWTKTAPELTTQIDLTATYTLEYLAHNWRTIGRPKKPLLVRLLHKARLRHYGRTGKTDPLPFQAYLEIADRTGVGSAVLWAPMCIEFYCSLKEGDTLLFTNYAIRERYQLMSKPAVRNADLQRFDLEVSLNKQGQVRGVKVVPPDDVMDAWQLPEPEFLFMTRDKLGSLPDEFNCDIVGIITFIGRYERHRKPATTSDMWLCRWVHLHDHTSQQPIRVLVFATSQPEDHARLCPGSLCVMTQLRVRHNLSQLVTSRSPRRVYLTTTNESQIYVHEGVVNGPYASAPVITNLTGWRLEPGFREMLSWRRVVGYHSYPPLPTSLTEYKNTFSDPADFQVTPVAELEKIVRDLRFRESRRVVIQGFILTVKFVPCEEGFAAQSTGTSPQKDSRVCTLRSGQRRSASDSEEEAELTTKKVKKTANKVSQISEVEVDEAVHTLTNTPAHVTGTQTPSASFLPRRYDEQKKTETITAINFPPNPSGKAWSQDPLSALSVMGSSGYFLITVSGINRNWVLNTLFLAPPDLSQHASFLHLLANSDSDPNTQNSVQPSRNVVNRLLRTSRDCGEVRMLFVLDLYNPGGQEVELVINRAFPVSDTT